MRSVLWAQAALALAAGMFGLPARNVQAPNPPLRALLIGGGPNRQYNQVGIESNVRYVARLLPKEARQTVLFADGNPKRATVQYQEESPGAKRSGPAKGEEVFSLLFEEEEGDLRYRAPKLARLDGPCQRPAISGAFDRLKGELNGSPRPLLLYFTGHGDRGEDVQGLNTGFDLWNSGSPLSVKHLAAEMKKIPASVPVNLVMVQCFSGGFGNMLFEGGDPNGALINRDFAGFYAATPDRMSAGCTPSLHEEDYQDFTSYFFAALSGKDRVGRSVSGADYNRDGRVGMNEAFAYSLIADESIDVPTCTSEYFLRRFVKTPEAEIWKTPYASLKEWADPPQLAALEGLSKQLNLSGEDRLGAAYKELDTKYTVPPTAPSRAAWRRFGRAQEKWRETLFRRWPALANPQSARYAAARAAAVKHLDEQARAGALKDLTDAADALTADGDEPGYSMRETRLLRFIRLGKNLVLERRLNGSSDAGLLKKWKRLEAAEAKPLL
jgi:hypothetical protein